MTDQSSLQDRLADAFKAADYDLPIEQRRDLADTALDALKRELDALAEYENTINWHTTCTSCARVLDSSIRETERAERAEAERDHLAAAANPADVAVRAIQLMNEAGRERDAARAAIARVRALTNRPANIASVNGLPFVSVRDVLGALDEPKEG